MLIKHTEDKSVYKYIHNNGLETTIKTGQGCVNYVSGKVAHTKHKESYTVFISSSVGCNLGCKFCWLTTESKCKQLYVPSFDIYTATMSAIESFIRDNPKMKKKYIKLSFMGMGDIFSEKIFYQKIFLIDRLIDSIMDKKLAYGVDVIDIGTILPKHNKEALNLSSYTDLMFMLHELKQIYNFNPNRKQLLRVFYSLHTFDNDLRKILIPSSVELPQALRFLKMLSAIPYLKVIFHNTLLAGINDDYEDICGFIDEVYHNQLGKAEFRFLKFNKSPNSKFAEQDLKHLESVYDLLSDELEYVKIQHSSGSEVNGSCGQFYL